MGLTVSIQPGDLAGLDRLSVDALVLPFYALRAQPAGVAGQVDWRLSGRLGRLIRAGRFTGAAGEWLLMASLGRVGAQRIFLLGLGPPRAVTAGERQDEMARMIRVLSEAGVSDLALAPPARPVAAPLAPTAAELITGWLAAPALDRAPFGRLVLLDLAGELMKSASAIVAGAAKGLEW